jgi:hypothetical protein
LEPRVITIWCLACVSICLGIPYHIMTTQVLTSKTDYSNRAGHYGQVLG